MRKQISSSIGGILAIIAIIATVSYGLITIYRLCIPKQGKILRYENFRGYAVPIIADGKGHYYRWIADVPWNTFTIEEKFDMARVKGGHLNDNDIQEIKQKYGVR